MNDDPDNRQLLSLPLCVQNQKNDKPALEVTCTSVMREIWRERREYMGWWWGSAKNDTD